MSKLKPLPNLLRSRINLYSSLEILLDGVASHYSLGSILDMDIITTGYEELNIKTITSRGTYLVKIFSKFKSQSNIMDYVSGLLAFQDAGVPVPTLLSSSTGYIYEYVEKKDVTYLCVMDYFVGSTFQTLQVSISDIDHLVRYIAQIHNISFALGKNYDSWGASHLLEEYADKKKHLPKEFADLIKPVIKEYRALDFSTFTRSIIHGDLQKNNVMRNGNSKYCILDLGCMDFGYSVIDLSTFIAHFCSDLISSKPAIDYNLYQQAINTYIKLRALNHNEISAIPTLVRATYASYLVAANFALLKADDVSYAQTVAWIEFSKSGLLIPKQDLKI